ncbi:hypothetical protein CRENBAI_012675 [Crenichthys baileyi]|uniref:Uncharacterized protein n=1 Tax=Crenichthys baileyi TaxID=28760 RepID=A0AAV9SKZ2_9TELE
MAPSVQLLAVRWQGQGPGMLCPSVNKKQPSLADTAEEFCNLALGGFHNLARGLRTLILLTDAVLHPLLPHLISHPARVRPDPVAPILIMNGVLYVGPEYVWWT